MMTAQTRRAILFASVLATSSLAAEAPDINKVFGAIPAYKAGDSRASLTAADDLIRSLAKDPAQRKDAEKRLLAILGSDATTDAKDFVCRELSLIGSAESVGPLAKLLPDAALSHIARFALERIPDPAASQALRDALGKVIGKPRLGIVNSLGARRDREAVSALAELASDRDEELAAAALNALGTIGGEGAAKVLVAVLDNVPQPLRKAAGDACLACADQFLAQGKKKEAAAAYSEVYRQGAPGFIRLAGLRGMFAAGDPSGATLVVGLLDSQDARLAATAAAIIRDHATSEHIKSFVGQLPKLSPRAQVLLLDVLAARRDSAVLPTALEAAKSTDESVRLAGLAALGDVGDASVVSLLAGLAANGPPKEADAARKSLGRLRGKDTDAAMAQAAQSGPAAVRIELIRALGARAAASAAGGLLKNADDPDEAIRAESLRALAVLGDGSALPPLVGWLLKAKAAPERAEAEKAVLAVGGRVADPEKRAEPVLAALPNAAPEARLALLRILGRIPSPNALAAIRAALKDPNAEVLDTAVRVVAEWPDAAPAADLLDLARTAANPTHKILALRGYIRVIGLPNLRPPAETVKLYADALAAATQPDEKKLALGGLGSVYDFGALDLAMPCLADKDLEAEAAAAVVQIAKVARKSDQARATAAVKKVLEACKNEAARQAAENALFEFGTAVNIALSGVATSPDGLDSDGAASGDQAAIDGNPDTYWDEEDGKSLYRLVVTFKQPEKICAISILGFAHHQYAPKDFDILCDDKVAKSVRNAQYDNNFLVVRLDETTCKTVELKITGYYGGSPAIRELGIYAPGGHLPKGAETPKK